MACEGTIVSRGRFWLLLAGFATTITAAQTPPQPSLQIYGFATKRHRISQFITQTNTRPFTVAVSGSNWWITTYPSPNEISETNFHWQVLSISNGLLAQCYYAPNVRLLFATLKPLVAPVACNDGVSEFVWLMLIPSVKADTNNKAILPPVYSPSAEFGINPDLRNNCEVEYLDQSRLWLRQVRFFNDGTLNSHDPNGTNRTVRLPEPYNRGFLEARFETLASTNWNSLTIPSRVVGEVLGLGPRPGSFRINSTIELEVAGIQPLPAGFTLPPLPTSDLALTDARAPAGKNQVVGFRVHDGQWPSLEFSHQVVEEDKRKRRELGLPLR